MTRIPATVLALMFTSPLAAETSLPVLTLLDGAPPGLAASLLLDPAGSIAGRGPCNRYSAPQMADLPAFKVETIISTKMACADLAAEQLFFDLLTQMEHAEQSGGVLSLTGAGHVMVFSSRP